MGPEIRLDHIRQSGVRGQHAAIEQHQAPAAARVAAAGQRIAQRAVARRKQMPGEADGKVVADDDALEMDGHECNVE